MKKVAVQVGVAVLVLVFAFDGCLEQEVKTNDIKAALIWTKDDSVRVVWVKDGVYAIQVKERQLRGYEWVYASSAYGCRITFGSLEDAEKAISDALDRRHRETEEKKKWDSPTVVTKKRAGERSRGL